LKAFTTFAPGPIAAWTFSAAEGPPSVTSASYESFSGFEMSMTIFRRSASDCSLAVSRLTAYQLARMTTSAASIPSGSVPAIAAAPPPSSSASFVASARSGL
jgi:hypothetical protein